MAIMKMEEIDPKDLEKLRYQPSSIIQRVYQEGIEAQRVGGAAVRIRVPKDYTVSDGLGLLGIDQAKPGSDVTVFSRPGMRALDANETAALAARLMTENRELRERVTALEIDNARLMGMSIHAQSQWMPLECPIVKADPEPLPQSEADRIWEVVKAAALT